MECYSHFDKYSKEAEIIEFWQIFSKWGNPSLKNPIIPDGVSQIFLISVLSLNFPSLKYLSALDIKISPDDKTRRSYFTREKCLEAFSSCSKNYEYFS